MADGQNKEGKKGFLDTNTALNLLEKPLKELQKLELNFLHFMPSLPKIGIDLKMRLKDLWN